MDVILWILLFIIGMGILGVIDKYVLEPVMDFIIDPVMDFIIESIIVGFIIESIIVPVMKFIIKFIARSFESQETPSKTITEPEPIYEEPEPIYEEPEPVPKYPTINGTKSSKPQEALFGLLHGKSTKIQGNKYYNTRVGRRYVDITYLFRKDKIAIEYDGKYYHKKEDHKRDNELINHGYKVLHFVSDTFITKKTLKDSLNKLSLSKENTYYHYQN